MNIEHIKAVDGTVLRLASFEPKGTAKAVIQLVHGFGEAIEHYTDLAESLVSLGHRVLIHDQRGFGPEAKRKGVNEGYDFLLEDIQVVAREAKRRYPDLPLFLFGHSMGGNLVLNNILRFGNQDYQGLIVESPWLRLHKEPATALQALARLAGKLSRNLTINAGLPLDTVSHNATFNQKLATDGIYHNTISMRFFTEIHDAGLFALARADSIKLPTLLFCALDDQIVSAAAIQEFHAKSGPNQQLVTFGGGYHCLHADENKEKLLTALSEFVNKESHQV